MTNTTLTINNKIFVSPFTGWSLDKNGCSLTDPQLLGGQVQFDSVPPGIDKSSDLV